MTVAKTLFSGEKEKQDYVNFCDIDFENRLDNVMLEIFKHKELKYLTLSGPTCSGKTTASRKLLSEFAERGKKVKTVSLDNFFRSSAELEEEARKEGRSVDFDSERALDIPCLFEFVKKLVSGETALMPHFDFKMGKRTDYERFSSNDADILIFEGIQAIYPVFTEMIKDIPCLSLVINVETPLDINGKIVDPRTIRLMRRIVRDYRFRSASPEFTFQLWDSVRSNEDINILPFTEKADIHINSLMGYEPCMLKPYLVPLLQKIPKTSPYSTTAEYLSSLLDGIDTISSEYIPKNGLYREFI